MAGCLAQENDIGVRLRIADALGHLGWNDKKVSNLYDLLIESDA